MKNPYSYYKGMKIEHLEQRLEELNDELMPLWTNHLQEFLDERDAIKKLIFEKGAKK